MENDIKPNFTAHLHHEQHPDSREAQLMRCMAILEQIAKAKDRLDYYADAGDKIAVVAFSKVISILQGRYDAQLKTLEKFGNPEQLEK